MGKLNLVDPAQYILEGEFEKIREQKGSVLDNDSVLLAVEKYNTEFVAPGKALGTLNINKAVPVTIP